MRRFSRQASGMLIGLILFSCAGPRALTNPGAGPMPLPSPLSATYEINGERITLVDGTAITDDIPGAASKTETRVIGEPVTGDLNEDGISDSALILMQTSGGSGTFYYVTAALDRGHQFAGLDAVLLGDRIAPETLAIRHGVIIVDYADRRPEEPMAVPPTVDRSIYLVVAGDRLEEIRLEDEELILAGEVVIGHEVRTIKPCGDQDERWLLGSSPALGEILAAYHEKLPKSPPYTPLLMVVTGHLAAPPSDGFGADYTSAILAEHLIKVLPARTCRD